MEREKDLREMGFKLIDGEERVFKPTGKSRYTQAHIENSAGHSLVNFSQSVPKHSIGKGKKGLGEASSKVMFYMASVTF